MGCNKTKSYGACNESKGSYGACNESKGSYGGGAEQFPYLGGSKPVYGGTGDWLNRGTDGSSTKYGAPDAMKQRASINHKVGFHKTIDEAQEAARRNVEKKLEI